MKSFLSVKKNVCSYPLHYGQFMDSGSIAINYTHFTLIMQVKLFITYAMVAK